MKIMGFILFCIALGFVLIACSNESNDNRYFIVSYVANEGKYIGNCGVISNDNKFFELKELEENLKDLDVEGKVIVTSILEVKEDDYNDYYGLNKEEDND